MKRRTQIEAVLLIALWAFPAVCAAGLSAHLAIDPHHHHDTADHHAPKDLLGSSHGHPHPQGTPDHGHSATGPQTGSRGIAAAGVSTVAANPVARLTTALVAGDQSAGRFLESRAGPPPLLFTTLCALLL